MPQAGGLGARPPPRQGPSRRNGGAKTPGPPSFGRSRGGWTTTMHLVAAEARPALAFAHSPGHAPAVPAGRQLLTRLGPPPARPALLRDRAYKGAEPRPLAVARGYDPVVPLRRSRVGPWTYAREMSTRRTAIARLFRRLKGFRRLCSRCEQLAALYPRMHRLRPHHQCVAIVSTDPNTFVQSDYIPLIAMTYGGTVICRRGRTRPLAPATASPSFS